MTEPYLSLSLSIVMPCLDEACSVGECVEDTLVSLGSQALASSTTRGAVTAPHFSLVSVRTR
jgi:hypothetical protein